jgi:hypothetical protein
MDLNDKKPLPEIELLEMSDFIVADVTLKDGSKTRVLRAATASQRIGGMLGHELRHEPGVERVEEVTVGVIVHRVIAKRVEVTTYSTNTCPKKPDEAVVRGLIAKMFPAVPMTIKSY